MNKKILGLIISSVFITSVGATAKGDVKVKIANVDNRLEYSSLGNNQKLDADSEIDYASSIKYKETKELLYEGYNPTEEEKVEATAKDTSAQEENQNTNETSSNGANNDSSKQSSNNESSLNTASSSLNYSNSPSNQSTETNSSSSQSQKENSSSKGSASQEIQNPSLKHVQVEGNVSSNRATQIDKLISSIPSNIVGKFKGIGGKIIITAKDIATNYSISNKTAGSISALYKYSPSNTIYVQGSSKSTSSVIHEFGHFVDEMAGSTKSNGRGSTTFGRSEMDDFKKDIFQQEKDAIASYLHSNYAKNSSTECFAEAFKIYVQNSGTLKSIAPRTYEVISQAVNSI